MTVNRPEATHPLRLDSKLFKETLTPKKRREEFTHENLQQQVEAFLKRGGQIQEIPSEEVPRRTTLACDYMNAG